MAYFSTRLSALLWVGNFQHFQKFWIENFWNFLQLKQSVLVILPFSNSNNSFSHAAYGGSNSSQSSFLPQVFVRLWCICCRESATSDSPHLPSYSRILAEKIKIMTEGYRRSRRTGARLNYFKKWRLLRIFYAYEDIFFLNKGVVSCRARQSCNRTMSTVSIKKST